MATLTAKQLFDLARDAGLSPSEAVVAAAVALAESGGRTDAIGDETIQTSKWGPSVGLWQVRSLKADYGTGRTRDAKALTDPRHNARAMAEISGGGGNWKPWSVFTSGAWRKHLDAVTSSVSADFRGGPADVVGDAVGGVVDAVGDAIPNPLAAFGNWQNDLQGVAVKLVVTGAALALVVVGVKAAAGGDE